MKKHVVPPPINWFGLGSGMTPEIEHALEELISYQNYILESSSPDGLLISPIPRSKPRELNLTNPLSLFTVQPFALDLRIPLDTTCQIITDRERMGYDVVLMVREYVRTIPTKVCVQDEVVVYCWWQETVTFSALRISGNTVKVGLSQDESQRSVHATMTLAEALKRILASKWTADSAMVSRGETPAYIVVARHKFDLLRTGHSCELTVYPVTPELFLRAVGLAESENEPGPMD